MNLSDIFEARKNPHLNPVIYAMDRLRLFSNRHDIYISFTRVDKLGVNPNSAYSTPFGIYSYPLKPVWEQIERRDQIYGSLPYGTHQPHINIIQHNPSAKVLHMQRYSKSDLSRDIDKIINMYYDSAIGDDIDEIIDKASYEAKPQTASGQIWNITRHVAMAITRNNSAVTWNKLLRDLGYDMIYDGGSGTIHKNEPTQCLFLHIRALRVIDRIRNK